MAGGGSRSEGLRGTRRDWLNAHGGRGDGLTEEGGHAAGEGNVHHARGQRELGDGGPRAAIHQVAACAVDGRKSSPPLL